MRLEQLRYIIERYRIFYNGKRTAVYCPAQCQSGGDCA